MQAIVCLLCKRNKKEGVANKALSSQVETAAAAARNPNTFTTIEDRKLQGPRLSHPIRTTKQIPSVLKVVRKRHKTLRYTQLPMSNYRHHIGSGGYCGIEVRDMHPRISQNFTYVSSCVKYMIFMLNFIFWLFGGLLLAIGLYAFKDKWESTGSVRLESFYDVILNISLVLMIAGVVVFVVSFAGCLGALRENTCLLKFYSMCLLLFFLMEMAIAIMGFVFPQNMNSFLEETFTDKIIHSYRDDPDLQNFIDFAQQEFKCCGLSNAGYQDWSKWILYVTLKCSRAQYV